MPQSAVAPAPDVSHVAVDFAVALRGVSKSYRRGPSSTRVLNHVNLQIARGKCVFLLGPSGSGKTTLLSLIGCVLRADEGSVQVLGHDVGGLTPEESADLRRRQLGFVFQRFHLLTGLTALENVCVPLTLDGVQRAKAEQRGGELLDLVGLADKRHVQPHRLSVGQCQRVALARALAADPPLVLADEPTASLDADAGQLAMELLRKLTVDVGKTAVIVTHDARILPYADNVYVVDRGQVFERPRAQEHAI